MIKVGVTGGIGSGKSRVCALFAALGIPVYDSDKRAKELMNGDGQLHDKITALFGAEAYGRDGRLDRRFVAGKVFNDPMLLTSLNGIVHPAVAEDFEAWSMSQSEFPYVILESAILFESGFDRFVDKIITVSAPEELRIERVLARDGVSRQAVAERIANQMADAEREARADYIINNDGDIEVLSVKVSNLDKLLRQ